MADQTAATEQPEPTAAPAPTVKLEAQNTLNLPTAALSIDIAADGKTLYVACFDGGVYAVEVETDKTELLGRHSSYASGVRLVPGTSLAISAGYDGALHWYALAEKKMVRRVAAHGFWSWDLAVSRDGKHAASATGQYLAGGYKYEPAAAGEPTVKVFDARTGDVRHAFDLTPPVQAVQFSPDAQFVAAGNLMGDVRVWNATTGAQAAAWNTPDLTSWGVSKSPHYVGGVHGMCFSPDGNDLLVSGFGPMYDPMGANGKQTWQRFAWRETPPRKVDEIHAGDGGQGGLMESLAFHPSGKWFLMAGRLVFGKYNLAAFDGGTGNLLTSLDAQKMRITEAAFAADGSRLFLAGAVNQEKRKDGRCPEFGRVAIYAVA